VVWDLEEEALETEILKLALQPLVENAVLHGLRSKPLDPCLTTTVKAAGEQTEILIMDNGSSIAPETLADIERNLELVRKKNFADGPHIGIRNVYQRLYLEYGERMIFPLGPVRTMEPKCSLPCPASIL
jgi:two-component system sensor histidine kinase YesM